MFGSIYVGMSGLVAHSRGLQTISHNVSNLNTLGFKSETPRFVDLYRGDRNDKFGKSLYPGYGYGGGVEYAYARKDFTSGDLQASHGVLDLAIDGAGFLPVLDGNQVRYLRTGQFIVGKDGVLEDKATGAQLTTLASNGKLQPFSIGDKTLDPPVATSRVAFSGNLSSGATEFSSPTIDLYDTSGAKHSVTVKFKPDNSIFPGRWMVTVEDAESTPLATTSLQFLGGIPEPSMDVLDIELEFDGIVQNVKLDFSEGVTNFSAGTYSSLNIESVNGRPPGEFASLRIDDEGRIEMTYSNGNTATLETVALAIFDDLQHLEQDGQGLFDAADPKAARYAHDGQNGLGRLVSGAVEASNVDLSSEFGRLILIQRGFQASSQVISTANEMIQQLFQMRGQG